MEVLNKKILLNSHSPRRRQILQQMGFDVTVVTCECEETYPKNLSASEVAMFLSQKKAAAFNGKIHNNEILISADTIVVLKDKILGKPKDRNDAESILNDLSNQEHKVITGCCIRTAEKNIVFCEQTIVKFAPLNSEEINYYIEKYSPFDKAGAYGVQEWIGMIGIERLQGDYYNVMGLPAHRLWKELKEI